MLNKIVFSTGMFGILLFATVASAQMYRWTDDDGNVVYSQTPPPDNRPAKSITAPPPPAENPERIRKETEELHKQLDELAKERKEKEEEKQRDEEERRQKATSCQIAKKNLKRIQERPPNTLWGLPDGSYKRFTVEERQKEIDKFNKIIEENCE